MSCTPVSPSCVPLSRNQSPRVHSLSPRSSSTDVEEKKSSSDSIDHGDDIIDQSKGSSGSKTTTAQKKLSVLGALFGECLCGPIMNGDGNSFRGGPNSQQFIELHGLQFIGLGAVMDELTPKERVYDTLEQLSSRTQRMISIGYLVDDENQPGNKLSESIPLDIWTKAYPDDKTMNRHVRKTIASIKSKKFDEALHGIQKDYDYQTKKIMKDNNRYLVGITAHNLGVVRILAGQDEKAIALFEEAIVLKRDAFGDDHPEVAVSSFCLFGCFVGGLCFALYHRLCPAFAFCDFSSFVNSFGTCSTDLVR